MPRLACGHPILTSVQSPTPREPCPISLNSIAISLDQRPPRLAIVPLVFYPGPVLSFSRSRSPLTRTNRRGYAAAHEF
ncbi:hypothetical protein J7T55_000592 [Diaporthe amygdali]|uniref:uncharacterized protein n=1 Tax=Phomopsis amygdali TaxID=1214568 RepID=UPI0022FE8CCD|nr:uncharacterized protein J7T55_000592 [Diaporthe amygdali]KAJ0110160.1 hypothetical protein J7T55_000592 [Diaporthe amygdali]